MFFLQFFESLHNSNDEWTHFITIPTTKPISVSFFQLLFYYFPICIIITTAIIFYFYHLIRYIRIQVIRYVRLKKKEKLPLFGNFQTKQKKSPNMFSNFGNQFAA